MEMEQPKLTPAEDARLDTLMSARHALTKPERKQLTALLRKARLAGEVKEFDGMGNRLDGAPR
jgi:hypothetical protein